LEFCHVTAVWTTYYIPEHGEYFERNRFQYLPRTVSSSQRN